jgi:elongation factor 1-beta
MGKVAVTIKAYIEDGSKLEETLAAISKIVMVKSSKAEEVAFGIKALRMLVIMEDDTGGTEALEEKIAAVKNVSQVQVDEVTLL